MTTQPLEHHPHSALFPLLKGKELDDLAADIKANGLRQPIVLHESKILDGRNRHLACEAAGVEPRFEQLPDGLDPLVFVISTNLRRRHLTDTQRRHIAADLATMGRGGDRGNQHTGGKPPTGGLTTAEAAKRLKVSKRGVERAKAVKEQDPEAHEAAKAGKAARAREMRNTQRRLVRQFGQVAKPMATTPKPKRPEGLLVMMRELDAAWPKQIDVVHLTSVERRGLAEVVQRLRHRLDALESSLGAASAVS